jgi:hypothetical protein
VAKRGLPGYCGAGGDGMTTKRVVFSFDVRALADLESVKLGGSHRSLGEAVRESLSVHLALLGQSAKGFTEIVVRNPSTGAERVIVIPSLSVETA